jgi:hypothetical protein
VIKQPIQLFASYQLNPVTMSPSIHHEPIDPDMGNVLVPLVLSPEQLQRLAADGVVASPANDPEFHNLYKTTVNLNLPVFVTSDALLHAYHLTFDQLLSTLEQEVFLPKLVELNQALLVQIQAYYDQLTGTPWEDAAQRTYAFLAVGSRLADPEYTFPEVVRELAQAEFDLIEAANTPANSPIFIHLKYGEDYTQYIPRGHYTKSEALERYFRAMMWYGRMTFRLNDPEDPAIGPDETRMALLLTAALRDGKAGSQSAMELWQILYDPTAFLVGRSDDLTVEDYLKVVAEVYGSSGASLDEIASDNRLQVFITAADELPAPRILGLISDDYKPMEAVKGLRLMGQRFLPDGYIFQELIHPKVPGRFLPSGLDVMAVMGSERAAYWLQQDLSTQNPVYSEQFDYLTGWVGDLSQDEWVETSYNAWLYALQPLLVSPGEGYPLFMQSTAWQDKQLNTALGSWAELKHDTLLYAKQPYGGLGGGGCPHPPSPVAAQSYVEPVPEVFARIAALAEMTRQGLEDRGLLELIPADDDWYAPTLGDRLDAVGAKALQMQAIAESQLAGRALTRDQQDALRYFYGWLEDLLKWVNGEKPDEQWDPAAVIADVATDPNTGSVLEVGIGNIHEIYVVAPIPQEDGSLALTVARGGIFSYYEFPSEERLTDEAWREMVKSGTAPDQPAFTVGFSVPEAAPLDIQEAIYRFQLDWVNWLYYTTWSNEYCPKGKFNVPVHSSVLGQAQMIVNEMRAKKQYEGRQFVSSDYLRVEQVAGSLDRLLVTVRETWQDFLASYTGSDQFAWYDSGSAETVIARRGPYSIDVEYELERVPAGTPRYSWQIVRVQMSPRPDWGLP